MKVKAYIHSLKDHEHNRHVLVEFAGGLELAEHRTAETLVEPAAISYMAYAETVQRVKHRLIELYNGCDTKIPSRLEEG